MTRQHNEMHMTVVELHCWLHAGRQDTSLAAVYRRKTAAAQAHSQLLMSGRGLALGWPCMLLLHTLAWRAGSPACKPQESHSLNMHL